ncbi:MAG: gliding motility-associated C-terminal domain-containing protein [Lewinellaceae bacterium]|nr:gliding motility-associated C-terminal domain-containing protein [Lewinellaceae bacterium]
MRNWNLLLLSCLFLGLSSTLYSQATVTITITGGTSTTTCTDIFGPPDPMWSVNIENQGWVDYPAQGPCFTALPHVQYTQTYPCLYDAPATVQVCFRAFENDGFGICAIATSCLETICMDFPLPTTPGDYTHTLALPTGLTSGGEVQFTISADGTGAMANEDLCGAVDAGVLTLGDSWGDTGLSTYYNYCATSAGEPSPADQGASWYNNVGLWFTFTTGPDPIPYMEITATSDPEGLGDDVNLQVALYSSSDGTCTGDFILEGASFINGNWDETLKAKCLEPNTTYYILVDGTADSPPELYGYFGLGIEVWDVQEAGDLRCDAIGMGPIPEAGSITTDLYTNHCATSASDPVPSLFFPDKPVWFSFSPPLSGHVLIQAVSNALDPINIQLALYKSADNSCTGTFSEVDLSYTSGSFDESMEVSCLDPAQTYWLLVDGATNNKDGIFTITISDEGDDTPVTNQTFVFCAGGSVAVGSTVYTTTGFYTDTILLPGGCDSVVITDLTVLEELVLNISDVVMASGLGNMDGSALAGGTGGLPPYSFLWSDGQTTAQATGLEGGATACVTITDSNGCQADTCFEVPFFTYIAPTASGDSLACAGDLDGVITFSAVGGMPPYTFTWQNAGNTLFGNGSIPDAGDVITLPNLPAGDYTITIADGVIDTTFSLEIWEPQPLDFNLLLQENASCFGECDGQLEIEAIGGTPAYQYTWSNGATGAKISALCAGAYTVTVVDANACSFIKTYTITQPVAFLASIQVGQNVSCFQGSDGSLTVTTTGGTPVSFAWSNGGQTATISNLPAGDYMVTVTNADGCQAEASATITEPGAPVGVSIQLQQEISCYGEADGILSALVSGPGVAFSYTWSNGALTTLASNLGPGAYSVTVANELGCSANAQYTLTEPTEIVGQVEVEDITCETEAIGGSLWISNVSGGVGPYLYSLDGNTFISDTAFTGLNAGSYTVYISDATGCEKSYSSAIQPPPVLQLELGEDQTVLLGEPVALDAMVNSNSAVFDWTTAIGTLDCLDASCMNISLLPVQSGLIALQVFDTITKCRAADSLFVLVIKDRRLYIPNTFSPNYDGVNDYFTVFGKKGVEEVTLFRIFDRNGALVFEAKGLQPGDEPRGWNGTFNGREAPPGVYTFFAEVRFIDGEVEVFKGGITLIR